MTVLAGIKKANEKGPPESSIPVRVAVLCAVLIAAHATLQQSVGGPVLFAGIMVGIPAAFLFSYVMRERPGFTVKLLLALGMIAAVVHFASQVNGSLENVAYLTRPLAELFLLTQLLHSFDVPTRRDLRFSLVSSLTLIALGGILSISAAFALDLTLWTIAAVAALVLMERSQRRDLISPVAGMPPETATPAVVKQIARNATPIAASLVAISALTTGVFLVLPASGTSRALTFPAELPEPKRLDNGGEIQNPTLSSSGGEGGNNAGSGEGSSTAASFGFTGFSKELDTSVRGRPDDTLVMRVRAAKPAFWRGQSFDKWDGRRWTASDDKPKLVRGNPIEIPTTRSEIFRSDEDFVQTFYLRTPGPNLVFAADEIKRIYFPDGGLFVLPDGTVRSGVALDRGAVYTVISHRPLITEEQLGRPGFLAAVDPSAQLTPLEQRRYLQLPDAITTRVRDLAQSTTAQAPLTINKVRALEAWMADNMQYSLETPKATPGTDAVDQFLFVDKIGFCEQIASALVVMLRSLGIPARLTVGYTPGERNPLTGLFEVKASNAHAWTEVWFPDVGWLPFDPTESVPLADDAETPKARDGLGAYLDKRLPAITAIILRVGALIAALASVGFAIVAIRRLLRRRRARRGRSWAECWHDELDAFAQRTKQPRGPGETARSYLQRRGLLDGEQAHVLADALATVEGAAFGPSEPASTSRHTADAALRGAFAGRRASETLQAMPQRPNPTDDPQDERQPAHRVP
jgi:protein-glutamine gamma-glutamyltransferase